MRTLTSLWGAEPDDTCQGCGSPDTETLILSDGTDTKICANCGEPA